MSNDLMQKLAISKKIMDKHNEVPRGQQNEMNNISENTNVNYNIPQDIIQQESKPIVQETISTKEVSKDAVLKSKLPDEIKKLMLENPIVQPQMNGATLSDEIVDGAARLMDINKRGSDTVRLENTQQNTSINSDLKQMIRDVVRDTVRDVVREELQNSGMITENTKKTNESLSLRVGSHIFEGKVLKIKKIKQ